MPLITIIVSDIFWWLKCIIIWWLIFSHNHVVWERCNELFLHGLCLQIALHEEPIGEGGYYDADCKDLRPALDWSLEKGWSVPVSQVMIKWCGGRRIYFTPLFCIFYHINRLNNKKTGKDMRSTNDLLLLTGFCTVLKKVQ